MIGIDLNESLLLGATPYSVNGGFPGVYTNVILNEEAFDFDLTLTDGNDIIRTGNGNDTIITNGGSDTLTGGAGYDTFVITPESNTSVRITDFVDSRIDWDGTILEQGDMIDLSAFTNITSFQVLGDLNNNTWGIDVIDEENHIAVTHWNLGNGQYLDFQSEGVWYEDVQSYAYSVFIPQERSIIFYDGEASGGGQAISGTPEDDTLHGTSDNDVISGEEGNDTLIGSSGADTLDGGAGADTVSYTSLATGVTAVLDPSGDGTVELGAGETDTLLSVEHIIGSDYDDSLRAIGAGMTLDGGLGNDTLEGGADGDTLNGMLGFDWLSYANNQNGVHVKVINWDAEAGGFAGTALGVGEAMGDSFSGINAIQGSSQDDYIDLSIVSTSGLTVNTGAGDDAIVSGTGNDTLTGGAGADSFVFKLLSNATDTITDFELGVDVLDLSSESFTAIFEMGDLTLSDDNGTAIIGLGNGQFICLAGISSGNLNASDFLFKAVPGETLQGGNGADTLYGSSGSDSISGDNGNDMLAGNLGNDHFVFNSLGDSTSNARDIISDFTSHDTIDLAGLGFTSIQSGAAVGSVLGYTFVNGNTIIHADGMDFSIVLTGEVALTTADFVF